MAEETPQVSEWVAQMLQQQSAQPAQMQAQQLEVRQQNIADLASIQAQQDDTHRDVRDAMSTITKRKMTIVPRCQFSM